MNLAPKWDYLREVAKKRLRNNKTIFHVDKYGDDIEVLGAAGELAARRFLGLPEKLHLTKDNGIDLYWRGWKVDVKATHMTKNLEHRFLQWPHYKPIKADIILMTAVNLKYHKATVIGFATANEVAVAPINTKRDIPCHEISVKLLHAAWTMQVLPFRR
jgi:hypothetical protein